ncbi:hypothetical protein LMG28138_01062 [Pararobbsia alpina]|uniref:Uncharacterized protein n=1 Tax=Pararobbsia alpina TaxID=621374 RepID=A0A6S7AXR3_9BURK|nr:hypothetical protein LMG28138_01062 [Pararobbsia alpina]
MQVCAAMSRCTRGKSYCLNRRFDSLQWFIATAIAITFGIVGAVGAFAQYVL